MAEPLDDETTTFAAEQAKEYGSYVAASPIYVGGARAFNPGHPVPASHVAANPSWLDDGLVVEPGEITPTSTYTAPKTNVPPPAPQGDPIVVNS